jgi:hypothetical protein
MDAPALPPLNPIGKKHDEFYKYWDRFMRVKGKITTKKASKGEGPSLDRDVEGRPGHPLVRSNTEGVTSRYVFIFNTVHVCLWLKPRSENIC